MRYTWDPELPLLLPATALGFPIEARLDGGPNGDGLGWGPFEYDPASNVCDIDLLTFAFGVHSTETAWVPGYGGGVHPSVTYLPRPARRAIQHVRLDRRQGTLLGTSTLEGGLRVPTNRANIHQVEIAGYSAWWIAANYGRLAVRDLDQEDLANLGRLIRWAHDTFAPDSPLVWYPKPAGNVKHSMSHRRWIPPDGRRDFYVFDHDTAPDASPHWDADDIVRAKIMTYAGAVPSEDDVTYPRLNDQGDRVAELQALLVLRGAAISIDGNYGPWTAAAVAAFQRRAAHRLAGLTVDGTYASPQTFAALETLPRKIAAT